MPYEKFSVGVLFENSIVCHVFYAMALGAAHVCVWFLGLVLFWFAWSSFLFVVANCLARIYLVGFNFVKPALWLMFTSFEVITLHCSVFKDQLCHPQHCVVATRL